MVIPSFSQGGVAYTHNECVLGNLAGTQIGKKYCPYKSAILDLSEERSMRNTLGRV